MRSRALFSAWLVGNDPGGNLSNHFCRTPSTCKGLEVPSRRRGIVSATTLLELLLIGLVCGAVVFVIPFILNPRAEGPTSACGPVTTESLSNLSLTSAGKELWLQRGPKEILSVDLLTGEASRVCSKEFRPIRYWNVSWDSSTYLLCDDDSETLIYRDNELIVSEENSGGQSLMAVLSLDGKTAIRVIGGTQVRCWDLSQDVPASFDFGLRELTNKIALDANGRRLFVSTELGEIAVYDVQAGQFEMTIAGSNLLTRAPVLSENGRWLAVVRRQSVRLYDTQSGENVWNVQTSDWGGFQCAAVSSDGRWVAISCADAGIQVLDGLTAECIYQFRSESVTTALLFSSTDDRMYSGTSDGMIRTWSMASGREINRQQLLSELRNGRLESDIRQLSLDDSGNSSKK